MADDSSGRVRGIARYLIATVTLFLTASFSVSPASAEAIRPHQWYLDSMHAEEMWQASTGKGITVAVIDTGVDAGHPDLKGQVLPGTDFTSSPGIGQVDTDGHGTGMAALIAGTGHGDNGQGGLGLAPGAKILPIRESLMSATGNTPPPPNDHDKDFSKAIHYAADSDAQIINISAASGITTPQLTSAVKYALSKNKLIFAGVGNDGNTTNVTWYPAATPGVVGVSAVDQSGNAARFSNHGPQVSLAAPGYDMVHGCAASSTGYCKTEGTSDATAIASASAALIWSAHRDWTANQVLRVMLNTAGGPTNGARRNDYIGYGVVRPRVALTTPGDPGPAGVNPLFPQLSAVEPSSANGRPSHSRPVSGSTSVESSKHETSYSGWLFGGLIGLGAIGGGVATLAAIRRNRRSM